MYAHWVLTALLVWPLVAAAVIWIAPERAAKHLALVASLINLGRWSSCRGRFATSLLCRAGALQAELGYEN